MKNNVTQTPEEVFGSLSIELEQYLPCKARQRANVLIDQSFDLRQAVSQPLQTLRD